MRFLMVKRKDDKTKQEMKRSMIMVKNNSLVAKQTLCCYLVLKYCLNQPIHKKQVILICMKFAKSESKINFERTTQGYVTLIFKFNELASLIPATFSLIWLTIKKFGCISSKQCRTMLKSYIINYAKLSLLLH